MAGETNEENDFGDKARDMRGQGRVISAGESSAAKVNLDEEIERNIKIRTMPRKFKISSKTGDKKTTAIGAVIMVIGLLVLAAAVYFAYIYLINPKPAVPAPAVNTPKVLPPVIPTQPSNPAPFSPPPATTTPAVTPPVKPIATSTAVNTGSAVATSTAAIPSAVASSSATSTLAADGLPPGTKIADEDKDGLSDAEEAILGTDPAKADTDGDGYLDGAELLSLYNPAGAGKITDNPHIGIYQDAAAKFSVDYPKIWQAQNLNGGQSIIFSAPDNSFIEVVAMPDAGKLSIKDWYNSQFSDTPVTNADVIAKNGWQGVFHKDRETFYLADAANNNIYTISYVPAAASNPSYYHIFLMMINSFTLK